MKIPAPFSIKWNRREQLKFFSINEMQLDISPLHITYITIFNHRIEAEKVYRLRSNINYVQGKGGVDIGRIEIITIQTNTLTQWDISLKG